jgi:hypothetical protein
METVLEVMTQIHLSICLFLHLSYNLFEVKKILLHSETNNNNKNETNII